MKRNEFKNEICLDTDKRIIKYMNAEEYFELYEYSNWLYSITNKIDFLYYQAYSLFKLGDLEYSFYLFEQYVTSGLTYLNKAYYYLYLISLLKEEENEYYKSQMERYYILPGVNNLFDDRVIKVI